MPYHNNVQTEVIPRAVQTYSYDNYPTDYSGALWSAPYKWYLTTELNSDSFQRPPIEEVGLPVVLSKSSRTGSNAKGSSPSFKYTTSVRFVKKRVVVGYINKKRRSYVPVRDKSTGQIIYQKRYLDNAQAVYITVQKAVRTRVRVKISPDSYIDPNPLHFNKVDQTVVPLKCHVTQSQIWNLSINHVRKVGFDMDLLKVVSGMRVHTNAYLGDTGYNWRDFSLQPIAPGPSVNEANTLSKLYNKVASEFPDYLVSLGESRESYSTVRRIFKESVKLALAMKRLQFKSIAGDIKDLKVNDIAGLWLEFQYGVRPILKDVTDSLALAARDSRTWRTYTVSDAVHQVENGTFRYPNDTYGVATIKSSGNHTNILRYGVIVSGSDSFKRFRDREAAISRQFSTLYELLPWSFIADWIIDIGSFLSSREIFTTGFRVAWKSTLSRDIAWKQFTHDSDPFMNVYLRSWDAPTWTMTGSRVIFDREILSSIPPMPFPRLAGTEDGISLMRTANATALILNRR